MQKNKLRIIALILLILVITGLFRPETPANEAAIYESLDVMAEIMTLVNQHSPGQVSGEKMVEGAIDGLLTQLDPHSNFYNEERYRTMREDQKGSFFGIGIIVGFQNDELTVISPLDGSPAMKAGIHPGDVIVGVDDVDTRELDFYDAIRLLRGEEGSPVSVSVKRRNMEEPLVFRLNRAEVPSDNVRASFMLPNKTGYVALRDFGETAAREVAQSALKLEEAGMERLILDLRGNPGGLLPQAIQVTSLFVPGKKLVVSTRGRLQNATQKYYSEKKSPLKQVPLIVLIDRGSASASEIVAGALQDHDRGLIVGVNSWGKGLVQSVFPLSDGNSGLALTTSRYYTPSGRNIQGSYESLDVYYNPESSENQYFQPPQNESDHFETIHGRQVVQVRGITPDVYFSYRESGELLQTLEAYHSAFFNFATELQEQQGKIDLDWQPDDQVFQAFEKFLDRQEIKHEGLAEVREQVFQKIKYQRLYIQDAPLAWQYLMSIDDHVKVAQELFGKARELLDVYNGKEPIRSDYAEELRNFALLKKETKNIGSEPN